MALLNAVLPVRDYCKTFESFSSADDRIKMYLLKNVTTVEMGILYCLFRISFEYRTSNTDCEF